jgi:hypothetical protein
MAKFSRGEISTSEMEGLRDKWEQAKKGAPGSFNYRVHEMEQHVFNSLSASPMAMVPGFAADASYRFNADLEAKAKALAAEGKDPSVLLDPTANEYVLKDNRLDQFTRGSKEAVKQTAAVIIQQGKQDRTAAPGRVIGQVYLLKGKGNMTYIGGPENLSTSWR